MASLVGSALELSLKRILTSRTIQTWIMKIKPALYNSLGYSSISQIHSWWDFFLCLSRVCTYLLLEEVNHIWVLKRFQTGWKSREVPLTFLWFSVGCLVINFFIIKHLQKPPLCGIQHYNTFISETRLSLHNSWNLKGVSQAIICECTVASIKSLLKQQESWRGEQEKLKIAEAAASGHESQICASPLWSEAQLCVSSILCLRQSLQKLNSSAHIWKLKLGM